MINYADITKIHIELSSACNAACPACPRNVAGGAPIPNLTVKSFTLSDFALIFPDELLARCTQIILCGRYGDPALCKDLPAILDHIASVNQNVYIRMHTNGGTRPAAWWASLPAKHERLIVTFSIDGLHDTNHIYRRGVIWNKLWQNVEAYISNGGKAVWEYLIFEHNEHQLEQARELAAQTGFNSFNLKRPYGFDSIQKATPIMNVANRQGDFEYNIKPAVDEKLTNFVWHSVTGESMDVAPMLQIDCHAVRNREIYVDALGNVHPCCWLAYAGQPNIAMDLAEATYTNWLKEIVGLENINAHTKTIEDIVASPYFGLIADTWDNTEQGGVFQTCVQMCAKQKNMRTKLIV